MCLDLTYDFAAASFLPVLKKVIGTCVRLNAGVGSAGSSTQVMIPAAPAKVAANESCLEKLKQRRDDKVSVCWSAFNLCLEEN